MQKDSDILMKNIKNDLVYTGDGDKSSKRKKFLLTDSTERLLK